MDEVLSKDEFLHLLDVLYKKAFDEERAGKFGIVSGEIKKLRDSFDADSYYKFPLDKTISIVCNLLDKNDDNYEGLRDVFRSRDVSLIIDIALAKIPLSFGKEMEDIYFDDDFIVGVHGSLHQDYMIENSHFLNGLLCLHGPKINRTVKVKGDGLSFYSFLQYSYYEDEDVNAIIVRIPKEDINSGIWKVTERGAYLNPKYIYGYYKSFYSDGKNNNPRIIKNSNYGKDDFSYNVVDEWLPSFSLGKYMR